MRPISSKIGSMASLSLLIALAAISFADQANAQACSTKAKGALMGKHAKLHEDAAKALAQIEGQPDKLCSYGETSGLSIWLRNLKELRAVVQSCPDPISRATLAVQERNFENYKREVAKDCRHATALKLNPTDARDFYRRGAAYVAKKDYDRATGDLTEAIRLDPQLAAAFYLRGAVYEEKGDIDRAMVEYIEANRLDPKYAGNPYFIDGDNEHKIEQLFKSGETAIKDNPTDFGGYLTRGAAFFQKGDYDNGIRDADEAIRRDPKRGTAFNLRANAYFRKGDTELALRDINEAIRIDANVASHFRSRGAVHLHRGDLDRALADLNEAIRLEPKGQPAYANRGLVFERMGKRDQAIADYKQAIILPEYDYYNVGLRARLMAVTRLGEILAAPMAAIAPAPAVSPIASTPSTLVKAASPDKPRRIALVIANSKYENVPVLRNPERDGDLVANTFRKIDFESVTLLKNMTKDHLVGALRRFAAEAETADWAVIYYAGHGMEVGGVNYLLPTDARIASDRDIGFEAVALDQVLNAAERAKRLRLVVLDACRDNPFANQMKRTLSSVTRSVSRGLAPVEPEAGTLVVYAAKDGETALDGDEANSPFTTAFVKNLQSPGLEIRRLFDFVRDDVMDMTNRRQKPFSYGSISGRQDFYFVPAKQ